MIRRTWLVALAEGTKWRRQWLPWVGLALCALGTCFATLATVKADHRAMERAGWAYVKPNGFEAFAAGASLGTKTAALFVLVLGALAMAGEAGQGTFRLLLVRPLRRGELFWGKMASLAAYALLALIVVNATAVATVRTALPGAGDARPLPAFGPLVEVFGSTETEYASSTDLAVQATMCVSLEAAALLGLIGLALFLSTCFDHAGVAMAAVLAVYMMIQLLGSTGLTGNAAEWLAPTYVGSGLERLSGLARHQSDAVPWEAASLARTAAVPLGTALFSGIFGWLLFRRRDILG